MNKEADQNAVLRGVVLSRLLAVRRRIVKGKGVWPGSDYIRDSVWDGWIAMENELSSVLREANIEFESWEEGEGFLKVSLGKEGE